MTDMQPADRVEKRRFVGREFLLWLWFESEAFEATARTGKHGEFGLWIERLFVLSAGAEGTRIKGSFPAGSREAKEALALGKLPESAGLHVSWGEREITFTLKAERLALSGLSLPTVLGGEEDDAPLLLDEKRRPKKERGGPPRAGDESDEAHEAFYERMMLTREVEELIETLYRDFLVLRLRGAWESLILPELRSWVRGTKIDGDRYRKRRDAALAGSVPSRGAAAKAAPAKAAPAKATPAKAAPAKAAKRR